MQPVFPHSSEGNVSEDVHRIPIISMIRNKCLGSICKTQLQLSVCQTLFRSATHRSTNTADIILSQRLEQDHFVQTVQKLRSKWDFRSFMTISLASSRILPFSSIPSNRYWEPILEVRIMIVFLKSTVLPVNQ